MKQLTAVQNRPSGLVLPLVLRQSHQLDDNTHRNRDIAPEDAMAAASIEHHRQQLRRADFLARSYPPDRQWKSASEIERALQQTWDALGQVQTQIQRGEETYYEESQVLAAGCNIFRGWDTYIDARIAGDSIASTGNNSNSNNSNPSSTQNSMNFGGNAMMNPGNGNGTLRRMPADFRWASNSCRTDLSKKFAYQPMEKADLSKMRNIVTAEPVVTKQPSSSAAKSTSSSGTIVAEATKVAAAALSAKQGASADSLPRTETDPSKKTAAATNVKPKKDVVPAATSNASSEPPSSNRKSSKRKERTDDEAPVALRRPKRKRRSS